MRVSSARIVPKWSEKREFGLIDETGQGRKGRDRIVPVWAGDGRTSKSCCSVSPIFFFVDRLDFSPVILYVPSLCGVVVVIFSARYFDCSRVLRSTASLYCSSSTLCLLDRCVGCCRDVAIMRYFWGSACKLQTPTNCKLNSS